MSVRALPWWLPAGAIALLASPPLRHALETSMTAQMLLQLPLLAVLGGLLAAALPTHVRTALARWDQGGCSGLLLASVTSLLWMLPRALDAGVDLPWVAGAKFLSLPLLVGMPLALSWPRMGFVLRGVVCMEAIASCFRLGWLFLATPQQLCSNYLLGDQQRLGYALLAIGVGVFVLLLGRLIGGRWTLPAGEARRPR